MPIVTGAGGTLVTGDSIPLVRLMALENAMRFEAKTGMQMTRGRSAYSIIKKEFGFKGNKQKVAEQMTAHYNKIKAEHLAKPPSPELIKKLVPSRFPNMSPKMVAMVAYILQQPEWTSPAIEEVGITADGFVLVRTTGEVGMNDLFSTTAELKRNWEDLLKSVPDFTLVEREEAKEWFNRRIGNL